MVPWARLELAAYGFLDRCVYQFHHQGINSYVRACGAPFCGRGSRLIITPAANSA